MIAPKLVKKCERTCSWYCHVGHFCQKGQQVNACAAADPKSALQPACSARLGKPLSSDPSLVLVIILVDRHDDACETI